MKKINKSYSENLPPFTIFLDDVEAIVGIIKEVAKNVTLTTEEYELQDPAELAKLNADQITNLEIESSDPYVSIKMRPFECWLYIADDSAASRGVLEKIKRLLLSRKRRLSWLIESPVAFGVALGAVFPLLLLDIIRFSPLLIGLSIAYVVFCLIWVWWGYKSVTKKHCVVVLKKRADRPSFWKRNRDLVMVSVLSAVLGSLATAVLGALFGRAP